MNKNNTELTLDEFHEILHKDIKKPTKDFRGEKSLRRTRAAHKARWAKSTVYLNQKLIRVKVYLNFKKNNITDDEYSKLKSLACSGISQYWSRNINVGDKIFRVRVVASHRSVNAIPVDLYVEKDKDNYARSMNPAILGIDASFIYNKGFYPNVNMADDEFRLVSAHEFGHSVLMYAGGMSLSWGHKGSTGVLSQSVKSSTPGYPEKGSIDLMKYYDWDKSKIQFQRRMSDSQAMKNDIKRLIWGAKIQWIK